MKKLYLTIAVMLLSSGSAWAASCPVVQTSPSFNAGGNVFGRIAAQWNAYFQAKVDAKNGTLCDPTVIVNNQPISLTPVPPPWSMATSTIQTGPDITVQALRMMNSAQPPGQSIYTTSYNRLFIGIPYANYKWLRCDDNAPSMTLCPSNKEPAFQENGDAIMGDVGNFGAADSENTQGVMYGPRVSGSQPGGPTSILSSETAPQTDFFGGAHDELYNDSASSGGPGPLRLGTVTSLGSGGTGYVRGEKVTLNDGCSVHGVLYVMGVDVNGVVAAPPAGLTVDRGQGGVCASAPSNPIAQLSTTGSGTGLTVNVTYGAPPYNGLRGARQIVMYNSDPAGHQILNILGRTGPGTLGLIAQITELQATFNSAIHVTAGNASSAANTTAIDNLSGTGRMICFGPDTSTVGNCQLVSAASDASISTVGFSVSQGSGIMGEGAIATNAANGFLYIASGAGQPTGTPTTFTGRVPLYYDSTNHQFWIYDGGWKQPKTPAGAATVTWQ